MLLSFSLLPSEDCSKKQVLFSSFLEKSSNSSVKLTYLLRTTCCVSSQHQPHDEVETQLRNSSPHVASLSLLFFTLKTLKLPSEIKCQHVNLALGSAYKGPRLRHIVKIK